MRDRVHFYFRGRRQELDAGAARTMLLDHLRLKERATGTKEGCNEGDCGACTVVLARLEGGQLVHRPVNACILFTGQADGAEVIAVEDLAEAGRLHPIQAAMVTHHGSQCGFCTPGIVMSLFALYQDGARPVTRAAVNDQLAGNLCRCTGYRPIIEAALEACALPAADRFAHAGAERAAALSALQDEEDVFLGDESEFFAAPASIASLAALYETYPDATLLAGATDIGLWVTKRLRDLPRIIWLGRVKDLEKINAGADEISFGAMASHTQAWPHLAALDPDLGELMRRFGSEQVRASGTIGGNIANGSPIGDLAPALIALDARLVLQQGMKERSLPLEDFFIDYGRQDRRPGEFVRFVSVPRLRADQKFRCFKLSKRFDEDISAVMGAFRFTLAGRRIAAARVAFGGMAAVPKRAAHLEQALVGVSLDEPEGWATAAAALSDDFAPISDMRASAAYRMAGARALVLKGLMELAESQVRTRIIARREATEAADAG